MATPPPHRTVRRVSKFKNAHTRAYDAAIFEAGLAIRPQNPYFLWRSTKVYRMMCIPPYTIKDFHLKIPKTLLLVDKQGNKWETKTTKWKDGRVHCHNKGWYNLYKANHIDIGDICVCEFVQEECNGLYLLVHVIRAHTFTIKKGIEEEEVEQVDNESTNNNDNDESDESESWMSMSLSKEKHKLKSSSSSAPVRRIARQDNTCVEEEEIEKIDAETFHFNLPKETRWKTKDAQQKTIANQDAYIRKLKGIIRNFITKDVNQNMSRLVKFPCHQDEDKSSDNDIDLIDKPDSLQGTSVGSPVMMTICLPEKLELLQSYFKLVHEKNSVSISLDDDVFGSKYIIYIFLEDINKFCLLEPISETCIVAYVWYLHRKMKDGNILDRFRFVNPAFISYMATRTRYQRARALADRLIGASTNQLVLVPCNVGFHWILTVIDPYNKTVFLLDPLTHRIPDETWQDVVDMALSMFSEAKGEKGKSLPAWVILKSPEAGYSKDAIDEVRIEWAEAVLDIC
ncbi:hypothetical protein C2S51_029348 [Perilla frutescens var. frutescens]|nr:hypothetical protein C2S51_029348 [Perilla frutescens var. frutescens]